MCVSERERECSRRFECQLCVCVCVCERERERETETDRQTDSLDRVKFTVS